MRIAQVEWAKAGQAQAVPLPHETGPLALDEATRARIAEVLAGLPDLAKLNTSIQKAPLPAAETRIPMVAPGSLAGKPLGGMYAAGLFDWRKAMIVPQPAPKEAAIAVAKPGSIRSFAPVQSAAIAVPGAVPVAQGLYVRPLPISRKTLAQAGQVAAWGQIVVEPLGGIGALDHLGLEQAGTGLDLLAGGVAVAEIWQQIADPRAMPRWKMVTFYLKRVLAIVTGASHFIGGGSEYMRVVGAVVKICDRGTDQYYAYKIEPSE